MRSLRPNTEVPPLSFDLLGGERFDVHTARIDTFLLIDVYRGLHCPRCHRHLLDLSSKLQHLERRGVSAVAVSMDSEDRVREARDTWGVGALSMGYGLGVADVAAWNIFLSRSINEREKTEYFAEPATFLITPDRTLYSAIYNTTPFNRFSFADMLEALEMIAARDYPPRGDVDPATLL